MIKSRSSGAIDLVGQFFRLESASGLLLVGAALGALVLSNTPAASLYHGTLQVHLTVTLGGAGVDKPLVLWVNDGLMAVFFLLVGLELKREILEGELSTPDQIALPALAAFGGLAVPAMIYWLVNRHDGGAVSGWAIPTATDIAFALAVLSLFGRRVPLSLKVFLTTIAIVDDLAAIVIIAVFYSGHLGTFALSLATLGIATLFALNRFGVQRMAAYLITGAVIWLCVLKSGVHATLAGVVVAAFIPLRARDDTSPARHLEHILHPWVAYAILPLFAFANAGVTLGGTGFEAMASGVSVGIVLGLFLGKQLGVFGMTWLAVKSGRARLPQGTTYAQVYGASVLCGIGFTMSLFIGSLAFEHGGLLMDASLKLGVIGGSVLSALLGLLVLHLALPPGGSSQR